jgi:flagellar motor switch protein FliM
MRDEAQTSVLRRKARAGKAAVELNAMTPVKALRLAAARAGDEVLNVPVGLRDLTETILVPEDIAGALPDPALFLQLDGPNGARGLAAVSPVAVSAMIEALTMGRVLTGAAAPRRPTRTDAVMVSGFLDQLLVAAAVLALECPDPPPLRGYLTGAALADARAGAMILGDCAHRHVTIELDWCGGAKVGSLHLVVPAESPAGPSETADRTAWRDKMQRSVLGTTARLEAVFFGVRLPLARVRAFAVGETLILNGASLDRVIVKDSTGGVAATGKLGRSGAARAVRLAVKRPGQPAEGRPVPPVIGAGRETEDMG